ncbi:MAG: Lon-like protease [Ilumatobacteraceae bacterium]
MASRVVSVATLFTLLAGHGLVGSVPAEAASTVGTDIRPAVDVPSPGFWDSEDAVRRGGQAARIELDDADLYDGMSTWYRLAYVNGGTRLQVFEHYPIATLGPESDVMRIEAIAWRLANEVVEPENRSTASDHLPLWAHVRTGNTDGPSAGLMMALAYIDLLTPEALVGDMRVAGTGGIRPDGLAFPVKEIDVKVATAMLTRPDVIFVTKPPKSVENVTIVQSEKERIPADGYTVGEWRDVVGYEQAGRVAADHPGSAPIVVVHDLRQALAWLCGRTDRASVCGLALRSEGMPIGTLSEREQLQVLVERRLVPRHALELAPLTMDRELQDLVDRGLIPRQALQKAPVAIIYGPARPLGAPDSGIPCSELVYTSC